MRTAKTTKDTTTKSAAKPKRLSKLGEFMRRIPKGEIYDMRAVLR